jgi:CBS domain-containing membrane protein
MSEPVVAPRAELTHREKWWSALGGLLGIAGTLWIALRFVDGPPGMALVASMGASAVLLFAAPHSPLSQPWNVLGGHLVSALAGVLCWRLFGPHELLAAPLAASLAILAMHYLRCLHPPGGATALVAVLGGEAVHALGFEYVLRPIGLNAAVILGVGLWFGALSRPRRYPISSKPHAVPAPPASAPPSWGSASPRPPIDHEDLVYALETLDTHIDVAPDDLLTIYRLATGHHADEEVHERLQPRRRA